MSSLDIHSGTQMLCGCVDMLMERYPRLTIRQACSVMHLSVPLYRHYLATGEVNYAAKRSA